MISDTTNKREILAIIPARSGSKSVIDKNIRPIDNVPMIAYSIRHALESKYITRVIVSTDSEKYAQISREYGAEVPFIRPAEYATDTALDIDVFYHALTFLKTEEGYEPELVVQLRPTYPIRDIADIDNMIERMLEDEKLDSMRCIAPAVEIPHKMWFLSEKEEGIIEPILSEPSECYNMPRQQLRKAYYQNACIDVIRTRVILDDRSMSGKHIGGYIMDENYDIDTEEDFFRARERLLERKRGEK